MTARMKSTNSVTLRAYLCDSRTVTLRAERVVDGHFGPMDRTWPLQAGRGCYGSTTKVQQRSSTRAHCVCRNFCDVLPSVRDRDRHRGPGRVDRYPTSRRSSPRG
jgi:hypothetical protein